MLASSNLARAVLFVLIFTSSAQAAPFEDLKADLATCLRFERDGAKALREVPASAKAEFALQRCEAELEKLDRADGRRLRGDGGVSPSTRAVLQAVFGRGEQRGGISPVRY